MASILARPDWLRNIRMPPTTAATVTPKKRYHHAERKWPVSSRIRVVRGSLALSESKKVLNLGSTHPVRMMTVTMDMAKMIPGYMSAELTLRRASRSRSM